MPTDPSIASKLQYFQIGSQPPLGFDCGRDEQNDFLHSLACTYSELRVAVTYLAYNDDECVGFVTLVADAIELYQRERPKDIAIKLPPRLPAVKIAQLGVHVSWQNRGVASALIGHALFTARQQRNKVGCLYLTVDAKPHVIGLYQKLGFKKNGAEVKRRRDREGENYDELSAPISMRLDLRRPLEP